MHLVVDCRMIFMSGIGRYLREILKRLARDEALRITCLVSERDLEAVRAIPDFDRCACLPMRSAIFTVAEQAELFAKIPAADLLWSPQYNIPLATLRPVRRRLVTIHDVYQLYAFDDLGLAEKAYVKLVMNLAVARSDRVITVSGFSRDELVARTVAGPERVSVIHNGVGNEFALASGHGASAARPYILVVGNIKPHKNLACVLEAYRRLAPAEYELVVVGRKEVFATGDPAVLQALERTPGVRITGHVSDEELHRLYAGATLFVFPSLYEGFGLPVLEAMAFGLPIVASDIPVLRELFDGAVTFFDPRSPADLAARIREALVKARVPLDYSATLAAYDWDRSAREHRELIRALAA